MIKSNFRSNKRITGTKLPFFISLFTAGLLFCTSSFFKFSARSKWVPSTLKHPANKSDLLFCLTGTDIFCASTKTIAERVVDGCGTASGKSLWRILRGQKGSGQPWFFHGIIVSAAESGLPVIELGASWEILSLPVFHVDSRASRAKIVTFQPDLSEFDRLTSSFRKNSQISIFPFGLASETKKVAFSGGYGTAGASAFTRVDANTIESGNQGIREHLELRDVEFILNITKKVSLLVINCEGCEFRV